MFRAALLLAVVLASTTTAQDPKAEPWPRLGPDGKPVTKTFRFKPKDLDYRPAGRAAEVLVVVGIEDKAVPADTFAFVRPGSVESVRQELETLLSADDGHLTAVATWVNVPTPERWGLPAALRGRVLIGEPRLPTDAEVLRGTWQVTAFTFDGRPVAPDRWKRMSAVITDTTFTLRDGGGEDETGSLKLDPAASPKQLDVTAPNGGVAAFIYQLKGGELTLAWRKPGEKRPTRFDPADCDGLMTLKRAKK